MENNLYIGKKQKKLFLSTEKEDIIKIEIRIVSGSFLRWPAIELIKRLDDTRGEILFHRVFFRRKDLYRSRRKERKRETVLVISFSLVVAGLRVYRIHGFDHSLANLPWTWRRRGGGRLGVIWRNNGVDKLDLRGSPEEEEEGKIEIRVSSKCLHGNSCAPAINQNFFFFFSILISVRATVFPVSPVSSSFSPTLDRPFSLHIEENRGIQGRKEISPSKRVKFEKFNSISATINRSGNPIRWQMKGMEIYI